MEWIILVVAGCLECVWAVGLKYTEGFSRPLPSIVTAVAAICSFWLLAVAMKSIPAGSAYAVWTGIGVVGVAVAGVVLFEESCDLVRLFCILPIVSGVIGLKVFSR